MYALLRSWLVLLLAGAASSVASAWGEEGHTVSARIADAFLSEKARAGIRGLIGERSIADKSIGTWADAIRNSAEYRKKYPDNQTWHYINLDVAVDRPDPTAKEFGDRNVLAAVERFRAVLKDRTQPDEMRKEALFFLVHFIADLHQPLHAASRNDDKGATASWSSFPESRTCPCGCTASGIPNWSSRRSAGSRRPITPAGVSEI